MFKATKNHKNLFTAAKVILFLGVLFLLYTQISKFTRAEWDELTIENWGALILVLIMVVPNIWLAYMKWKVTIDAAEIPSDKKTRIQSFFAGLVTGVLTPNMIGNFLGRLYYFDKNHRGTITWLTFYANYAQFITSLTFGFLSIYLAQRLFIFEDNYPNIRIFLCTGVLAAYLIYFFADRFGSLFSKKWESFHFVRVLSGRTGYKFSLLGLSYSRFFVYTTQYMLMLHTFGEEISLNLLFAVWQVYLLTMIAPSLILGKVGVKESIALLVLSQLGLNNFAVLFSTLTIWLVNTMAPALVGLAMVRKRETE